MKTYLSLSLAFLIAGCATMQPAAELRGPMVAHHQHIFSERLVPFIGSESQDAAFLLRMMDAAGSRRAVVLSMAYSLSDERKQVPDSEAQTRLENDWVSTQVSLAPSRLVGFCSVNPLMPTALTEIERCNRLPGMHGLKLHIGNSGVTLQDPVHAARMREVFALADRIRVPIVVHMRPRGGANFGPELARIFIDQLLPVAPHIVVQIAHLGGSGPGYSPEGDAVLAVFAEAIRADDPRTRNVIFDATTVVAPDSSAADGALIAQRLRQIGIERIVFGSDLPVSGNPPLAEAWALFRTKVALTPREFSQIARNIAPYLRPDPN